MAWLVWLCVGKPRTIAAVAAVWGVGCLLLRASGCGASRHPRLLLVAATGWGLSAAWEWLVLVQTPEAHIRVDLLGLWPRLALGSAWALYRALRQGGAPTGAQGRPSS